MARMTRMVTAHLLERDDHGVWQLTEAGHAYIAAHTISKHGYTVKMGLAGDALMYRDNDPEVCIAVDHYLSRAHVEAWIDATAEVRS